MLISSSSDSFIMAVMTLFHSEKCCHLVSENETSATRIMQQRTAVPHIQGAALKNDPTPKM